jgi:hypothetical protein
MFYNYNFKIDLSELRIIIVPVWYFRLLIIHEEKTKEITDHSVGGFKCDEESCLFT